MNTLRTSRARVIAWLALLVGVAHAAACASPPREDAGRSAAAITHGSETKGDPAIVGVVIDGLIACTGVVIHPRIVVTAGHCLVPTVPSAVIVGSSTAEGASIPVIRARRHPDADIDTIGSDLAYLVLAADAPVSPVKIGSPSPADVGAEVRVVGFGRTDAKDTTAAIKRQGTSTLDALDARTVTLGPNPSQPCKGDSGGPVFLGDRVVAIVSEGDSACAKTASAARLDASAGFLDPALSEAAAHDLALGSACVIDESCASKRCVAPSESPTFPVCSVACAGDDDCAAPLRCQTEGAAKWCLPSAIPGALGSPCEDELGCDSTVCALDPGLGRLCSEICFASDPASCPEDFMCSQSSVVEGADAGTDTEAVGHCFPSAAPLPDQGCSVVRAPPSSPTSWGAALALLPAAMFVTRRRTSRPRRGAGQTAHPSWPLSS